MSVKTWYTSLDNAILKHAYKAIFFGLADIIIHIHIYPSIDNEKQAGH